MNLAHCPLFRQGRGGSGAHPYLRLSEGGEQEIMTEGRGRDDEAGDQEEERLSLATSTGIPDWVWEHTGGFAQDREKLRRPDQELSHDGERRD